MPRPSTAAAAVPIIAADRLRPPSSLTQAEKKEFTGIVLACPSGHFRQADLPLVVRYAKTLVAERHAAAMLDAEPIIEGNKPSPWLAHWQARTRAITTFARMLGVNPAGRSSVKAPADKQGIGLSYYQRMALAQEAEHDEAQ